MLVDERTAAIEVPQAPSPPAPPGSRHRRGPLLLVGGSVLLAALSLLGPSTPTYDPWAWIIWGREITQLDLVTDTGPSWKPLPVAFTTVFALFGSAAPLLWVVVARAGAIAAVVLAFRVARRLGGGVAGGVAAAAALAIAPWWIRNSGLGNSEGLLVALLLAAIDRLLAGERRAAFWLGCAAALLRPEVWPFLGLYGLWLLWRREMRPLAVVGAGVAVLALWTLPEWWGSGDPLRAAHRAQQVNPGAPTYADNPAIEVLRDASEMLTEPLLVGLGAALAYLLAVRRRDIALLGALAAAWLAVVAAMTSDGFSGNQRYLIAPVAVLIVLAGAGAGWAAGVVARAARSALGGPRSLPQGGIAVGGVSVLAAVVFAGPSLGRLGPTMDALDFQAGLTETLPGLIDRAGGVEALKRCGDPYTDPFLVPMVAWHLRVHSREVGLDPRRPAVVFRVRRTEGHRPEPTLRDVGPHRTAARNDRWRIVLACGGGA